MADPGQKNDKTYNQLIKDIERGGCMKGIGKPEPLTGDLQGEYSRQQEQRTVKGGSKKSKNRSIKYVCPCCGTIIRATREVNVICGDCNEPFERE